MRCACPNFYTMSNRHSNDAFVWLSASSLLCSRLTWLSSPLLSYYLHDLWLRYSSESQVKSEVIQATLWWHARAIDWAFASHRQEQNRRWPFLECPSLFMLVKMQSKPFQKQDIVAPNHQTLSTCHIMGNLKVSCIGRHCCNALLIKAVIALVMQSGYEDEGLCRPGWAGPQRACSSVRPLSVACLLIPVRRASSQQRKLFAVCRTCQEIHKCITFHFENITKD